MRRALLSCVAIAFALACGDNITEPIPERTRAVSVPVSFATTTTEDGLSISTDKDDYQPGDVVHLTGSGWEPGDVLDIVLTDDPLTHDPHRWTVTVGEDGTFYDQTYVVDEGDLDVKFTLVATSRATGRSLTVQFTDSNLNNNAITLSPASVTVTAGNAAAYTVSVVFSGNNNACTVTLSTSTLPSGAAAAFNPTSVTGIGGETKTSSLTITTTASGPSATPPSTYTFTVTGTIGAQGCSGQSRTSAPTTLVVDAGNQPPVVDAGGPYSGNRNVPISLGGATATDPDGDALTYAWTYAAVSGVPAGTTCSFSNAAVLNPTFTCTNVGTFKVTLTVDDGQGHIVADDAQVTATNGAPTADAGGPYNGEEGSPVALDGSATDPDGDALTYKWTYVADPAVDAGATCSFDDDTKADAKVTCTDDGTFKLTLTATDPDALTGTDVTDLVLTNANPNASAGGPPSGYSGNEGSAIQLDGTGDDPGDNDDAGLTYKWTINTTGIDAGGTCTFDDDTKEDPKLTCTDDSNQGQFILSLVVQDDDGGTSAAGTANIAVNNVKPVANAGAGPDGYSGEEGSAIQLAGSGDDPGDNDDPYLTYHWTVNTTGIDAGGTCTFDNANDKNAKVTCTDDSDNATGGYFKLTLIVSDDEGNSSVDSYANLTVTNAGPVAEAGGPYNGSEGSPVQLDGTVTDAGGNDTHTWFWKYVDGAGIDGGSCSFDNANAQNPKITCTDDGTVQLTLKVTDDDGADSEDTATLTLANVNPVASAGGPYTGFEGSPVSLNGSVTDAGSNDTHTWSWQYVAGAGVDAGATCTITTPTAEDPTITCTDDGTVKLTLTVTDDDGGADTDEATLTLTNANPVANAGGPYSGNEGAGVSLGGSKSDAGSNDTHTYAWTYAASAGVDAGATCVISNATALSASINCTDDGTYQVTLTVTDDDGGIGTSNANVAVANVRPDIAAGLTKQDAAGSPLPSTVFLNGTVDFRAAFSDPGSNDTHSAQVDCTGNPSSSSASVTSPFDASCTFSSIGPKVITVTITDDDGASHVATHSITVQYNFSGFFAPVDRPNTMNVSKAGQSIPLKWRLTDAAGQPVTNLTSVTVQSVGMPCGAYTGTDVIEEYAAGLSGLQNLGDGNYQFNWKTPAGYAGTCKSIALVFGAGSGYTEKPGAYFTFKK